jgi:hypothetical protein
MNSKLRVGIVGANPSRGFASIAHIPALQALPDFEISAVCTTRQDSADAAASNYGAPLAFCDAEKMAQHPDVDLVTVSVKVPDHYRPVMAAIEAGKHVYCEWPLGRSTDEAAQMLAAAERRGVRHAVGLQGQVSPAICYVKGLTAEGYVGRVLKSIEGGDMMLRRNRDFLQSLADLRNILSHVSHGQEYIAEPSQEALEKFEAIVKRITQPPLLRDVASKPVKVFEETDTLLAALTDMKANDYSQIVIRRTGQLGLVSPEGITQWILRESNSVGLLEPATAYIGDVGAHEPPTSWGFMKPKNH